jgi:cytochrome c-type biogenesis protein CcmH
VNRREFLVRTGSAGALTVTSAAGTSLLFAQDATQPSTGVVEMNASAYKPVRREPKAGATPQLDKRGIDDFERQLACPCPCTLDVYTCRTTDFSCSISPAVHADINALVAGGYGAAEIMAAMTDTYGDYILLAPRKRGFNLLAWFAPFAVIGIGLLLIAALLRRWRRNSDVARQHAVGAAAAPSVNASSMDATPEELARLAAVLRDDSR